MLKTYCTITGYELASAHAFSAYGCKKLVPSQHPIFSWSESHLYDFLRNNFVKREHTEERVLLMLAILHKCKLVEFRSPLLIDSKAGENTPHINKAFTTVVNVFRKLYTLRQSTDSVLKTMLAELPTYRVSQDNYDNAKQFVNYCERLLEKVEYISATGSSDEYDAEEDSFNLRLTLMGLDVHSIAENDRLPKRFTPEIAEWAAYQYALYTGAEVGSTEYTKVTRILNGKVTEKTNINEVHTLKRILGDVLPMPENYELDKAKSLLTLKRLDTIISEHSQLMAELFGTEIETSNTTQGGVTWTIIEPTAPKQVAPSKPTLAKVQDKDQKRKVAMLLARKKG